MCRACEKNIKRYINNDNYHPRWVSSPENHLACIVPDCGINTENGIILQSSLCSIEEIEAIYKNTIVETITDKSVPLCQTHYKYLYRLLNADKYDHPKCVACNASLREAVIRHCPDSLVITQHFNRCDDIDITINKEDKICTSCYNSHLEILWDSEPVSHDHELQDLLKDDKHYVSDGKYTNHIVHAIKEVIRRLGHLLMKNLAALLPELYQVLITEGTQNGFGLQ